MRAISSVANNAVLPIRKIIKHTHMCRMRDRKHYLSNHANHRNAFAHERDSKGMMWHSISTLGVGLTPSMRERHAATYCNWVCTVHAQKPHVVRGKIDCFNCGFVTLSSPSNQQTWSDSASGYTQRVLCVVTLFIVHFTERYCQCHMCMSMSPCMSRTERGTSLGYGP